MNFEGWSNLIHDSGNFFQVFFPASSHEKQELSFTPYVWSWNWNVQVCRQQAAGSRQSMETGHWKSCCRIGQCGSMRILWIWYLLIAFARTWIYDGLLTCYPGFQIRDSFLAALDFSLPLFAACSGFWLVHLGNMSDLVQLFKSGHFSLDLYMLCKLFRIR